MRPQQNQMVPEPDQRTADPVDREAMRTETHGDTRTDTRTDTRPDTDTSADTSADTRAPTRPESGSESESHSGTHSGPRSGDEQRERLVPADHAASYASRWDAVKGAFVDEPRQAVAQADALVGEVLDELETLFREQRRQIEQGLDNDEASTEDLRLALRRYRSFFDRLLAV
jgi:hypothetical protein